MKSLVILIVVLITPQFLCQNSFADYSIEDYDTSNIEGIKKDSNEENYLSYSRTNFSVGWQSQFEPLVINSRIAFTLSYTISNFFYLLQESKNQIGLFNEIGVNNMSVYIQAGPELRLLQNIFIVPKIELHLHGLPE